jgi:hypothetical protein
VTTNSITDRPSSESSRANDEAELHETRDEFENGTLGLMRVAVVVCVSALIGLYFVCMLIVDLARIIFK